MPLEIVQIPVLQDNYIYLIHEPRKDVTAVVDPALAEPVLAEAAQRGWRITHILNTHHHWDHVGGNQEISRATNATIIGPLADEARIPGIDVAVADGDSYALGEATAQVFDVPGHTRGHIAYYFEEDAALFCGDTVFALGCGRLFEGTPKQMWASLSKLAKLPFDTRIYCAHEYTQANGRFALTIEPENKALIERMREVDAARARKLPTVPSLLGQELATNPFLRAGSESRFAEIRHAKDHFKS